MEGDLTVVGNIISDSIPDRLTVSHGTSNFTNIETLNFDTLEYAVTHTGNTANISRVEVNQGEWPDSFADGEFPGNILFQGKIYYYQGRIWRWDASNTGISESTFATHTPGVHANWTELNSTEFLEFRRGGYVHAWIAGTNSETNTNFNYGRVFRDKRNVG